MIKATARKPAPPSVIQVVEYKTPVSLKNVMTGPVGVRELMSIVHKRINVLSGSMVLVFKNGPKQSDFAAWAEELRTCAAQLDRGRQQD